MARKKASKKLDEHIAELEAVISEVATCAACGKPLGADATTCPHCGTPVGEAQELHERATESLSDLEKQLAEALPAPDPAQALAEVSPPRGLASAAEVVAMVKVQTPEPAPAPSAEVAPEPVPEPEPQEMEAEEGGSGDLEGFIEEIEAEVGPGTPQPAPAPPRAPSATKPTVRAVPRAVPSHGSGRWVTPVAAGAVMYVLSVFFVALLDRLLVASFMVVASLLVMTGIRVKPLAEERRVRGSGSSIVDDYVCPLCGTGISAHATRCPTCGAVFED